MRTYTRRTLSFEFADHLVKRAFHEAAQLGIKVSVCIVDESGVTKAYGRMDGAPLVAEDACRKKARTAVGFGLKTGEEWHDFIKDDPILSEGAQALADFILLGGGAPITVEGDMVGAIGVAGGHYQQDEACVLAALKDTAIEAPPETVAHRVHQDV